MSILLLGVNIDHIATVRNVRDIHLPPDPIHAAFVAEQHGADSITVHLREDRRHIIDRDVYLLRKTVQTRLNLEMAVTDEMVDIACKVKPDSCCLVPESREEITTEGGLNVISQKNKLCDVVAELRNAGIRVSLFVDPDDDQIKASADIGVACIEINTGFYAGSLNSSSSVLAYEKIKRGVDCAAGYGLSVNAGHGLDYYNVELIAKLSLIEELNIGHAIIARSVFSGLGQAVKDMKQLIMSARG